ncbi:MAG: acetate--CoA ligase family protein [Desulfovibrio sp.]|jgi:acetyltransferase|nr:acetate--CoA ligase family protein [Desulfovibrio sp.]
MSARLQNNIAALFAPKAVCVLGASRDPAKIGHILLRNLLRAGFPGKIFPINPYADKILGLDSLRKPADIPAGCRPLCLAVICLPAEQVPDALCELGRLPTRAAVIISAGFSESGGRGAELEEKLAAIARDFGIALLGPNSIGLYVAAGALNATFVEGGLLPGYTGFFSQSGAFTAAMFDWAADKNFGFSTFVSLGGKVSLDESDMLAYLADDPHTKVIVGYIENVSDGPRFLRCAYSATRKKPVILFKAGRGGRSFAGSLDMRVNPDLAYDAAFTQTGVIRAKEIRDIFGMAQAFASCSLPVGPALAVVGNGGRIGAVAADSCLDSGLVLAPFSDKTVKRLETRLPSYVSARNPVDLMAGATPERFAEACAAVLEDPAVNSLLLFAATSARGALDGLPQTVASLPNPEKKPILACLMGGMGVAQARRRFFECGIPCYSFPEPAIKSLAAMYRQSLWKDNHMPVEIGYRHDKGRARAAIEQAAAEGLLELGGYYALEILSAYEIPCLDARLARTEAEAVQIARLCGGPVALKIASPHILSKSGAAGVALNLQSPDEVRAAFADIASRSGHMRGQAGISGCIVQAMAPKNAHELVLAFNRHNSFGPMLLFGLRDYIRLFDDLSCRLAPLSLDDAGDMLREVKAFPILAGLDGQEPVKLTALEDILLILSQIAVDFPEIQEVECNPVLADPSGAHVWGARILLSPAALENLR